mmetsp:Transcript_11191/g.12823  ORF Transcript_11191/g.12823 Transcript_11191/m.12823 type:complete len:742 (-) Transcript_11191:358-2583(-)|eukprot:CAMPEP_0184014108 /NCGR_PEP_ID=MMETSP0954-20121128/5441_1 /TAXON_ID=627963 /ORGANISM="Aplanochytrium sp, Strain PBS07" /LENGTH=741 /DNA_ID=CAMNT_0026294483 /DNA_START=264 /DNA_END=2489 /DNA_ORIENTATION=-
MALTSSELGLIQEYLGATKSVLSSAVARLHLASPDPSNRRPEPDSILNTFPDLSPKKWTNSNVVGGLVLVVDRENSSVLFQIYDLDSLELRFEYELYENIEYEKMNSQFHAFEMQDCVAGFQFTNGRIASQFWQKVNKSRPVAAKTKEKKKGRFGFMRRKSRKKIDDDEDFGRVVAVEHKGHMGLDENGAFDLDNIPSEWKHMFRKAGIRKADLKDADTAKNVIETIQNHEMNQLYKAQPEYAGYSAEELESMYTPEMRQQYMNYQREVREYEKQQKAQEQALAAWELNEMTYTKEAPALPPRRKKQEPPKLPPRKKGPGKAATQFDLELAQQQKKVVIDEADRLVKEAEEEKRKAEERAKARAAELERQRLEEERKAEELEKKREIERQERQKAALQRKQQEDADRAKKRNEERLAKEREAAALEQKKRKELAATRYAEEVAKARREAEEAKKAAEEAKRERDKILMAMKDLEKEKTVNNIENILESAKHQLEVAKYNHDVMIEAASAPEPPMPAPPPIPALPSLPKLPAPPVPAMPKGPKTPALPTLPALPKPKKQAPPMPKTPAVPSLPTLPASPKEPPAPKKTPAPRKTPAPEKKPALKKTPPPMKKQADPPKKPKIEIPKKVELKKAPVKAQKKASHNPLLVGIQKGVTLKPAPKHVSQEPKTIRPPPNLMMMQIQEGVKLKRTNTDTQKRKQAKKKSTHGDANAELIAKLAEAIRGNVKHDFDDDSEDDWSDDDY